MEVSKQEAQAALEEIASISERTKRTLSSGASPEVLMLWGLVWVVGNLATHFEPRLVGLIWSVVGGLGFLGTIALKARHRKVVTKIDGTSDPNTQRIAWFWAALTVYTVLWLFILEPWGTDRSFVSITRRMSAFFATIPMFAYVVGGLWLGRFYIWLGAIVTALTVVGLYALPEYFWIWMAAFGGGALLLSGIQMKRTREQL